MYYNFYIDNSEMKRSTTDMRKACYTLFDAVRKQQSDFFAKKLSFAKHDETHLSIIRHRQQFLQI